MTRKSSLKIVLLLLVGAVSLVPLIFGTFGPTVLAQRGLQEPRGLGELPLTVFRSLMTLRPGVSSRGTTGFWPKTPAKPGEYIVAVNGQIIAGARSDGQKLAEWFTCPSAAPVAVFGAIVSLCFLWRWLRRPHAGRRRLPLLLGVMACALIGVTFFVSRQLTIGWASPARHHMLAIEGGEIRYVWGWPTGNPRYWPAAGWHTESRHLRALPAWWPWKRTNTWWFRNGQSRSDTGAILNWKWVAAPLWLPFLSTVVLTVLVWRRRRLLPGLCENCAYDLTGNESGICPECGIPTCTILVPLDL